MRYDVTIIDPLGKRLEVLQELPSKGNKFPTVILVPGFGVDLHEYGFFDTVVDVLVKHGFQTFRFSFEGTGKSEGQFETTSVEKQVRQLKGILDYILKDRFTDRERIGVWAHSFGGIVTIASLPLDSIKTFILSSVPSDPRRSLEKWFRQERGFNPEGISHRQRSDRSITTIGQEFWKSLERHDFLKKIRQLSQPTLLLYGEKDSKFSATQGQIIFEKLAGGKKFLMIERADHSFTREFRLKAIEIIVEWFDEELR